MLRGSVCSVVDRGLTPSLTARYTKSSIIRPRHTIYTVTSIFQLLFVTVATRKPAQRRESHKTYDGKQQSRKPRAWTWDGRPHPLKLGGFFPLITAHHGFLVRNLACVPPLPLAPYSPHLALAATGNRNEGYRPCNFTKSREIKYRPINAPTCVFFDGFSILGFGWLEQQ